MYIHNNGKGWGIFIENPNNHRDFAYVACHTEQWSTVVATYYETKEEAQIVFDQLKSDSFVYCI